MSQDLKISKILVAVDGSDNSMRTVDYAIKLALRFDVDLIALLVAPGGKYNSEEDLKYTKREYSYLDKIGQKSVTAGVKPEIDVIKARSSVVNEITQYADKKYRSHRDWDQECFGIPFHAWQHRLRRCDQCFLPCSSSKVNSKYADDYK
ncbi:MAG: universal stress protein [Nitrososphaeraceae archaeon]